MESTASPPALSENYKHEHDSDRTQTKSSTRTIQFIMGYTLSADI